MPVILNPDGYDLWLDPGMTKVEAVSEMLKPYDARAMRCYPVSTLINHVANDDEECSARVELTNSGSAVFVAGDQPGSATTIELAMYWPRVSVISNVEQL